MTDQARNALYGNSSLLPGGTVPLQPFDAGYSGAMNYCRFVKVYTSQPELCSAHWQTSGLPCFDGFQGTWELETKLIAANTVFIKEVRFL
ncbi:hypothetical protein [Desulfonatronospira sp.]|uniref:hypothetical protein n=1 Tax=Desulfonatronospira sp. TaxID=1962951 RepID=UPI0025C563BB|nr:hypothetical protein [Desulfonatronospira sp.]